MREVGQEVVLHFACKDMNRNGIESRAWKAASAGLDNILALIGDYPIAGQSGTGAFEELRAPDGRLLATHFFLGCVVTNHKFVRA